MKIYIRRDDVLYVADVPDGALNLQLGSSADPGGGEELLPGIEWINRAKRLYRRVGCDPVPIPEHTYKTEDLVWRESGSTTEARYGYGRDAMVRLEDGATKTDRCRHLNEAATCRHCRTHDDDMRRLSDEPSKATP